MKKQTIVTILLVILIIGVLVGIGFLGYGVYKKYTRKVQNPIATIEIQDYGTIKVELQSGHTCSRCWQIVDEIDEDELCHRCAQIVKK